MTSSSSPPELVWVAVSLAWPLVSLYSWCWQWLHVPCLVLGLREVTDSEMTGEVSILRCMAGVEFLRGAIKVEKIRNE